MAAALGRMGFPARLMSKMVTFMLPPEPGRPSSQIAHAVELLDGESRLLIGPHGAFKEAAIIEELAETLYPNQAPPPYEVHGGWSSNRGDNFLSGTDAITRFILDAIERATAFLQHEDLEVQTQPIERKRSGPRL